MFTSYDIGAIKLPPPADRLTPPTLCRELLSTLLALGLPEPGRRIRLRASRDSVQRAGLRPCIAMVGKPTSGSCALIQRALMPLLVWSGW